MSTTLPSTDALAQGAKIIGKMEGVVLHSYLDTAGVWTIGIGTIRLPDGSRVTHDTPNITYETAVDWMMRELRPIASQVDALLVSLGIAATVAQRAVAYSFSYNEGFGAFRGSGLLKAWKTAGPAAAAEHFKEWVYSGGRVTNGLVIRREYERQVFLGLITV